ncbi:hypothetical protein BKG95_02175 [Rodentibacter pneumotropicus]|nr:hypothetical protein BKG95_02175 [Rodentibacter pneumotropicus]
MRYYKSFFGGESNFCVFFILDAYKVWLILCEFLFLSVNAELIRYCMYFENDIVEMEKDIDSK